MPDVIKEARDHEWWWSDQNLAFRMIDEIERQHNRAKRAEKERDDANTLLEKRYYEIEQLRDEIAEHDGILAVWRRRCTDADTEIEQLRAEIKLDEQRVADLMDDLNKAGHEIERLTAAHGEEVAEWRELTSEAIDKPFTFGRQSIIDAWQVQWSMRVKEMMSRYPRNYNHVETLKDS